jgi:hypothetical protein
MIRITIVEHITLPAVLTSTDSPVWQDDEGNQYRVASGLTDDLPEMAWQPENGEMPKACPQKAVIIAGMDGLDALSAMGLIRIMNDPAI